MCKQLTAFLKDNRPGIVKGVKLALLVFVGTITVGVVSMLLAPTFNVMYTEGMISKDMYFVFVNMVPIVGLSLIICGLYRSLTRKCRHCGKHQ